MWFAGLFHRSCVRGWYGGWAGRRPVVETSVRGAVHLSRPRDGLVTGGVSRTWGIFQLTRGFGDAGGRRLALAVPRCRRGLWFMGEGSWMQNLNPWNGQYQGWTQDDRRGHRAGTILSLEPVEVRISSSHITHYTTRDLQVLTEASGLDPRHTGYYGGYHLELDANLAVSSNGTVRVPPPNKTRGPQRNCDHVLSRIDTGTLLRRRPPTKTPRGGGLR